MRKFGASENLRNMRLALEKNIIRATANWSSIFFYNRGVVHVGAALVIAISGSATFLSGQTSVDNSEPFLPVLAYTTPSIRFEANVRTRKKCIMIRGMINLYTSERRGGGELYVDDSFILVRKCS